MLSRSKGEAHPGLPRSQGLKACTPGSLTRRQRAGNRQL